MAKLIGYMNMKNKHGKVLVLVAPIRNNGVGETSYTKNVYDEVADSIDESCIGKEVVFGGVSIAE